MIHKIILQLIMFFGIWIFLYISVSGLVMVVIPQIQGTEPEYIGNPFATLFFFFMATYMICGAGHQLDIIAEREKREAEQGEL